MSTKFFSLLFLLPIFAWGHGGGLNAEGCHNNHKTGDYHCHRTPPPKQVQNVQPAAPPVQREQPGGTGIQGQDQAPTQSHRQARKTTKDAKNL